LETKAIILEKLIFELHPFPRSSSVILSKQCRRLLCRTDGKHQQEQIKLGKRTVPCRNFPLWGIHGIGLKLKYQ